MNIPTAAILVAYGRNDPASLDSFAKLAQQLAIRLDQPVIDCVLDGGKRPLINAIAQALTGGAVRLLIIPLFLSPSEYKSNAIAEAVIVASRRWPFLQFHLSPQIAWADWVSTASNALSLCGSAQEQSDLTILLAAQHDTAEVNADLAKTARLLYEANQFSGVEFAYVGENGSPSLSDGLARLKKLDVKEIVVMSWLLFAGTAVTQIKTIAAEKNITVTPSLAVQPALLDLLVVQQKRALADRSLLPVSWEEVERQLTADLNNHDKRNPAQSPPDEDEYQRLNAKINAILPPRYQGRLDTVSSAPMSAADLQFDAQGNVSWDEMFGFDDPGSPFCELALAGGPSHRGELLEAVTAESCQKERGKYTAVVTEIERGIRMITRLPTVTSETLGWVGMQCDSDAMAIWLTRAIIVENVMVRREGDVLYLPAGSHFTLKNEIKSIVTVTAKTCHYWMEHISRQ